MQEVKTRTYNDKTDRAKVIQLWETVFEYTDNHNKPAISIDRKIAANDSLFFVIEADSKILGTVMAGYDGHRGWIYSLAVMPDKRSNGLGSRLLKHAESALKSLGCPKINLQILERNQSVVSFYEKLGYKVEPRISMGKAL